MYASVDTFGVKIGRLFTPKFLMVLDFGIHDATDCDAPCFEQLKATDIRASPKQQALLDVLIQLIKTWPLTIGPCLKVP